MIYDVAIVGAGPSGASAAYALEQLGHRIVLIDKEKFPRNKPCAGVLPPRIYSELEIPKSIMERPLEGYRLFSPSGVVVESAFPKRGLIVRREKFDYFLVKRVKTELEHVRVSGCVVNKNFVEVFGDRGSFCAKFIVGADGVNSVMRKMTGIAECGVDKSKDMALAIQYEISLSKKKIDERLGNWFEVYYTIPFGYGWISPLKDAVKVGVGGLSADFKKDSKKTLDEFLEQPFIKEKILDGKIERIESHLIPMRGPFDTLTADRIVLGGDAGGFVFPGTGEGVFYAIKSGRIAAEVISQGLKEQRFDSEFLGKSYAKRLEKNGLTSLREVDFVENVLSSPEKADEYVRRLKTLSGG
ncbi:MAG: geranylgeranyl reductase family protein [Thermoplasmata archaeon]